MLGSCGVGFDCNPIQDSLRRSAVVAGLGIELLNILGNLNTRPIDEHTCATLKHREELLLVVVYEVCLRELRHILITHKVHNACSVGNDSIQDTARLKVVTAAMSNLSRRCRDEQAVLVEAEDCHRLHALAIGVNSSRVDNNGIGSYYVETDSNLIGPYGWIHRLTAMVQNLVVMTSHS